MVTLNARNLEKPAADVAKTIKKAAEATKSVWTDGRDPNKLRKAVSNQEKAVANAREPWKESFPRKQGKNGRGGQGNE